MKDIIRSISTIKNFMGNAGRNTCNEYLYEALTDAVESMEGNIPEKPIRVKVGHNGGSTDGCPVCKKDFYDKVNFCPRCGKAIDWSVKNG